MKQVTCKSQPPIFPPAFPHLHSSVQRSSLLVGDNAAVPCTALDLDLWLSIPTKCSGSYSVSEVFISYFCFPAYLEGSDPKGICFSSADTLMMLFAVLLSLAKDKAVKFGSSSQFDPEDHSKQEIMAETNSTVKTVSKCAEC